MLAKSRSDALNLITNQREAATFGEVERSNKELICFSFQIPDSILERDLWGTQLEVEVKAYNIHLAGNFTRATKHSGDPG